MYNVSGKEFDASMECLLSGPTLYSLLMMMNRHYEEKPMIKVDTDFADVWEDDIAFYKSARLDLSKQIFVRVNDQPTIDVGGVRAQFYSTVYNLFTKNGKITLFDCQHHCHTVSIITTVIISPQLIYIMYYI